MFALTQDEVEASDNMVEGTMTVLGHPARVLMDSGATHNFVSESFACTLSQTLHPLESDMVVTTPSGDDLQLAQWFHEVPVVVFGCSLPADLRVLRMHDFDMIFEMDWLSQHHTYLDCFERRVLFHPIGEPEYSFRGSLSVCHQPVLSFLEARDLICSGCSTFLTCLVSFSVGKSLDLRTPYDVLVVSEFIDIFPEELLSLSPH